MISAVVRRQQPRGLARVSQDLVKIDHRIEFTAAADPGIDLLTNEFFLWGVEADSGRVKGRVLERRVSRPNDSNSLFMCARYSLAVAGYLALGAHALCCRCVRARAQYLVP